MARPKLEVRNLAISYGGTPALMGVNLEIYENEIFGIIGPANSGKTSFLKALNRMDMFNSGHAGLRRDQLSTAATSGNGATSMRCAGVSAWSSRCRSACR